MSELRAQLREFLLEWFQQHMPGSVFLWYDAVVLAWIAVVAIILHFILRRVATKFLKENFFEQRKNLTRSDRGSSPSIETDYDSLLKKTPYGDSKILVTVFGSLPI